MDQSSDNHEHEHSPAKSAKKLGKKIKHQFHRLTSHHVTSHTHHHLFEALPVVTSISVSPLLHPSENLRRASFPPNHNRKTSHRSSSSSLSSSSSSSSASSNSSSKQTQTEFSFSAEDSGSVKESLSTSIENKDNMSVSTDVKDIEPTTPVESVVGNSLQDAPTMRSVVDLTKEEDQSTTVEKVSDPLALDPFFDGGSSSEGTRSPSTVSESLPTATSPQDTPLPPSSPQSPNLNEAFPSPPSETTSEGSVAPDLYLPGLLMPTLFLPIPNTDPLSTLLTKYIYPPEQRPVRDVTGEWQGSDFHTLVMSNSWRALARMAKDKLVTTNPEDVALILNLWYLRLACLARLRLFNQTSAECTNLFVVLNAIEPVEARTWVFDRILPFELEVIHARLKYWAGDHMGHLDALNALLRKCRTKARAEKADSTMVAMWKERASRICLILASQLVEMKDFRAATRLLEPLCEQGETSTAALRASVGRIYLQCGMIQAAKNHFETVAADPAASQELKDMNTGLLACAEGDWTRASSLLEAAIDRDDKNFVAVNNLAVTLLSQGRLKDGIDVLERALKASPSSVVVAEPFLFNLSTLYELRSATAASNKRNLLEEVAKWSGDGLRTTCLKMPTT